MTSHLSLPAVAAGTFAGSGFLLLQPPAMPPWRRTVGLMANPHRPWPSARREGGPPRRLCLLAVPLLWLGVVVIPRFVGRPMLAPLPAAAAVAVGVSWVLRVRNQRRGADAARMAEAVAEAVGVLAADLSVGRSPPQALTALADDTANDPDADPARVRLGRLLRPVAESARLGGSVPESLRAASVADGCSALGRVAAAWQLAESTGAPIGSVLGRVATALRRHADHVRDVRAELAGPRASARLLATLPVVGLLMGTGLGAQPMHVLLTTAYGQVALCAGVALELAGLAWTDRIARVAEGR